MWNQVAPTVVDHCLHLAPSQERCRGPWGHTHRDTRDTCDSGGAPHTPRKFSCNQSINHTSIIVANIRVIKHNPDHSQISQYPYHEVLVQRGQPCSFLIGQSADVSSTSVRMHTMQCSSSTPPSSVPSAAAELSFSFCLFEAVGSSEFSLFSLIVLF
jgi:hypothetical protein